MYSLENLKGFLIQKETLFQTKVLSSILIVKSLVVFLEVSKLLQENCFSDALLTADSHAGSPCPLFVGLQKAHCNCKGGVLSGNSSPRLPEPSGVHSPQQKEETAS